VLESRVGEGEGDGREEARWWCCRRGGALVGSQGVIDCGWMFLVEYNKQTDGRDVWRGGTSRNQGEWPGTVLR
jgi:hypothetical protein